MNPTLETILRLAYILLLVFLGIGLRAVSARVKKLKIPLGEFFGALHIFAIWVILPLVVFVSVWNARLQILEFMNAFLLAFIAMGVCFVTSVAISHAMREDRKTTIALVLNSSFMNVVYLGFPTVYILLGPDFLGPAALYAMGIGIPHIIFGTMLASHAGKRKITLRRVVMSVLTFPAAFALIAALLFVGFQAPIPELIPELFNVYLAPVFFAFMLLLIGYEIPLVDPRKYFRELITVGTFRFIVSPIVTYIAIVALGLSWTIAKPTSPPPSFLMAAMPPALFNIILANNFNLDAKLYGALVFYPTLVSLLLILPITSMLIF